MLVALRHRDTPKQIKGLADRGHPLSGEPGRSHTGYHSGTGNHG
jgi:hypothetical protein